MVIARREVKLLPLSQKSAYVRGYKRYSQIFFKICVNDFKISK